MAYIEKTLASMVAQTQLPERWVIVDDSSIGQNIFSLLVPGGMCVVIDMNNRFPFFRSDLTNRFRRRKEKQCSVPSLEEYAMPFFNAGFEVLRKEHFCWVPHSLGAALCRLLSGMSPLLNVLANSTGHEVAAGI
jgi:hypothetical protein